MIESSPEAKLTPMKGCAIIQRGGDFPDLENSEVEERGPLLYLYISALFLLEVVRDTRVIQKEQAPVWNEVSPPSLGTVSFRTRIAVGQP